MDFPELWAIFGPGVAGAVFGAGWWFWVDAVVCSSVTVSFLHYLPGPTRLDSAPPLIVNFRSFRVFDFGIGDFFCRDFCFFGGFDVQLC